MRRKVSEAAHTMMEFWLESNTPRVGVLSAPALVDGAPARVLATPGLIVGTRRGTVPSLTNDLLPELTRATVVSATVETL
jgi:hypothetical protein